MSRKEKCFALLVVMTSLGCGTDHSEEIASLQKQAIALTRQAEEMQKQTDALLEGQQKLRELIGNLEVEVGRLKPQTSSAASAAQTAKEQGMSAAPVPGSASTPTPRSTTEVSCPQVWKLLGQGQDEATVAQALGITEDTVRACQQEVGRGRRRR